MRHGRLLTLLILAVPEAVFAQAKVPLGKPDAESTEGFTQISSIRELLSGKILVVDRLDKVVQLLDLANGTVTKVGREGSGPNEYALPISLLPQPDGTTLLLDMLNRRLMSITADGKPGAFVDLPNPDASSNGPGRVMLGGVDMRNADAQGRIYFQGAPFSLTTGTQLDSVPVLRWTRSSGKIDTVAWFKLPTNSASMSRQGGGVNIQMGSGKVFSPTEGWATTADGRIARVTPVPYRVIWYDGASRMNPGPIQAYSPIKVGEAEKQLVREQRKKQRPMIISFGGPGGGGGGAAPPTVQAPEPEFEETMPPFDRTGVLATPEGEVWVLRNRPASDKVPTYDVFDRTGVLVKKISLAQNSRVVGFGKGTVYVARSDEDDLQYLQRYRRP